MTMSCPSTTRFPRERGSASAQIVTPASPAERPSTVMFEPVSESESRITMSMPRLNRIVPPDLFAAAIAARREPDPESASRVTM